VALFFDVAMFTMVTTVWVSCNDCVSVNL